MGASTRRIKLAKKFSRRLSEEEMQEIFDSINNSLPFEAAYNATKTFYRIAGLDLSSNDEEIQDYLSHTRFYLDYGIHIDQEKEIRSAIIKRLGQKKQVSIDIWSSIGPTTIHEKTMEPWA